MKKDFAVYNENDEFAAEGLRELIKARLISPGEVDQRSISDVTASDYSGFTRIHLFAGAGAWDIALNHRRWPEGRKVGTGSCPCPPFSAAGKKQRCPGCGGRPVPCPVRTGYFICTACSHAWFADGRHLWPEMFRFVTECGIADWFGEQVASADGRIWYAGVRASLEPFGYAVGSADLCAPGVGEDCELGIVRGNSFAVERGRLGPPHIRQRLFWHARWMGHAERNAAEPWRPANQSSESDGAAEAGPHAQPGRSGLPSRMVHVQQGLEGHPGNGGDRSEPGRVDPLPGGPVAEAGGIGGMADGDGRDPGPQREQHGRKHGLLPEDSGAGFWSDFDFVPCLDGKARRVKSGLRCLADGCARGVLPSDDPSAPYAETVGEARQARIRWYGNMIVWQVASEFIASCEEVARP